MNEQLIKKSASKVKLYGDLDSVIISLLNYKNEGKNVYVDFNGTPLYSLLDNVDSCYMKITGMNRNDYLNAKARIVDENRKKEQLEKEQKQENIKLWINEGKDLIYPQKFDEWKRCVQARAEGAYKGFDLDNAIKVMKELQSSSNYDKAREIIFNANHSGGTYGMAVNIIINFSKKGPEFFEFLEPEESKNPKNAEYLKKIKRENSEFEKINNSHLNKVSELGGE